MMSKLIGYWLEFRRGLVGVVRRYPAETALQTVLTALFVWWTEAEAFPLFPAQCLWIFPLFSLGALVLNTWAGRGPWRIVYYVIWAPLVPLLFWRGLPAWVATEQFALTLGVLVPLALLVCRRVRDNRHFAANLLLYLRAAVVSLLFANIALGLFEATLWSAAYIFGFDEMRWVEHLAVDVVPVAEFLAAPMLFLLLLDRWEQAAFRMARIGEVVINWIFTPALVVYALLLHAYVIKILIAVSLPRGGVAYMVFGFILTAFVVRVLRESVEKRVAEWFYARFSFVMLVPILLFWVGAARRVGEYGLTAPRVYLLVCGCVMTLAVIIFSLRSGRYSWLFASAFVLFAAVAYVPALSPARIGMRSQRARFERLGRELGMLDAEGRFVRRRVPLSDSVRRADYADLFSAMRYVGRRDTAFCTSLGLEGGSIPWTLESELLPWNVDSAETVAVDPIATVELPQNCPIPQTDAYPNLYANVDYWRSGETGVRFASDTLRVMLDGRPLLVLSGEELVRRQMEQAKLTFEHLFSLDEEQAMRFLDYRGEQVRVVFRDLKVERRDSISYGCAGAAAELLMTR